MIHWLHARDSAQHQDACNEDTCEKQVPGFEGTPQFLTLSCLRRLAQIDVTGDSHDF